TEVDRRGGLAHPALLVGHGEDARGTVPVRGHRVGDGTAHRVRGGVGRAQLSAEVHRALLRSQRRGPRLGLLANACHRSLRPSRTASAATGLAPSRRLPAGTAVARLYVTRRAAHPQARRESAGCREFVLLTAPGGVPWRTPRAG